MAEFDESKVINALYPEKAEVGKKYWYSDSITWLKRKVENNEPYSTLKNFKSPYFEVVDSEDLMSKFFLLYPYEEPPKQRMTHIQFMEWVNKGNGIFKYEDSSSDCYASESCIEKDLNKEVSEAIRIRTWDSEEWVEPTIDIYERDCKKEIEK